jgi:hypothetical protein
MKERKRSEKAVVRYGGKKRRKEERKKGRKEERKEGIMRVSH